MKQKLFLTTIILYAWTSGFSQSYIIPGKIILNDGDTLNGLVHDKQWDTNPVSVEFQKNDNSPVEKFNISDIKAFSTVRGILYERHYITYDDSKEALGSLSVSRDPEHFAKETVFLNILVKGGISLSSFVDVNNRKHFFIHDKQGDPKELLSRSFLMTVDGHRLERKYEPWRQQLFLMANDCPSLATKIKSSAEYTQRSLIPIFRDLNSCKRLPMIEIEKQQSQSVTRKPEIGLILIAHATQIHYEGLLNRAGSDLGKAHFGLAGSLEIFSRKRPERISLYNEIRFKNISQDANGGNAEEFRITSIKLVNTVRFSYPAGNNYFFWNIGISNGYNNASINYVTQGPYGLSNPEKDSKKGFENGFLIGAGLKKAIGDNLKISTQLFAEYETSFFKRWPIFETTTVGIQLGFHF